MSLLGREFRTLSSENGPGDPDVASSGLGHVVAFYGVRDLLDADDPALGAYTDGTHPACDAAVRAGLELCVTPLGDGASTLWLGRALGELQAAGTDGHVAVDPEELARAMVAVAGGLGLLGRAETPALHLQLSTVDPPLN